VFSDTSFLYFVDWKLGVADYTEQVAFLLDEDTYPDVSWENLGADLASQSIQVLDAFKLTLDTTCSEGVMDSITATWADADDPSLDAIDENTQSWSDEDTTQALQQAKDLLAALAQTGEAMVELSLESTDGNHGFEIHQYHDVDPVLYEHVLHALVDISAFEGYTLEYNDGASDRLSGYSKDATVFYTELDLSHYSSHEILEKRHALMTQVNTNPALVPLRERLEAHFHAHA
jgi:hypothetical protein